MQVNLALIAERLRHQADVLTTETHDGPIELCAATFLRTRAQEYDQAQREMADWIPVPCANVVLDPRPARRLLLTAAIMGGIGVGFLAYVFMAVHP